MDCSFPKNLASLRRERGISQKKAAGDLHISQALLSHYEKGIRECGLDFLCRAADYYGVTADYLLGRSESRTGYQVLEKAEELDGRRELCRILWLLYELIDQADDDRLRQPADAYMRLALYRMARLFLEACGGRPDELFTLPQAAAAAAADGQMQLQAARLCRLAEAEPGRPSLYISVERLLTDYPNISPILMGLIQKVEKALGPQLEPAAD